MTAQEKQLTELTIKVGALSASINAEDRVRQEREKRIDEAMAKILAQTTKTNGRVTKIEKYTSVWVWFQQNPKRFLLILPLVASNFLPQIKLLYEYIKSLT